MQPNNPQITKKAQGLARAKMLIRAHLFWLNGYPTLIKDKMIWQCPFVEASPSNQVEITAKLISKAQRTINELLKDFPIALPKIVGDTKLWATRCKQYLTYVKSLIINPSKFADISLFNENKAYKLKFDPSSESHNQELLRALSWLHYIDRKPLAKSLTFIANYPTKISNSKLTTKQHIHLTFLYSHEGKKAENLINLVLKSSKNNLITSLSPNYFKDYITCVIPKPKKSRVLLKPPRAPASSKQATLDLLAWVVYLKTIQRKRALSLVNSFDLSSSILKWGFWWKKADLLSEKIENIIKFRDKLKAKQLQTLQKKLKNLQTTCPDNLDCGKIVAAIKTFSANKELTHALPKLFSSFQKKITNKNFSYPKRVQFLSYFHMLFSYGDIKADAFSHYILLLARHIKAHPECHKNSPWHKLRDYYWGSIESTVFEELNRKQFKRFFTIIATLSDQQGFDQHSCEQLVSLIAKNKNDDSIISLSRYLLEKKKLNYISNVVIKISHHYKLSNPEFLKLLKIWHKFDEEYTDDDTLEVMFDTFVAINMDDIFRQLLFSGYANQLRQDCYQVRIIKKLIGISYVPKPKKTSNKKALWIEQYPPMFNSQLKLFNSICHSAEKKVHKIFSSHWWSTSMLQLEIAKVEKQLLKLQPNEKRKILPRLQNLQNKLSSHKTITETEILAIQSKLATQLILEQYKTWKNECFNIFKTIWTDFFGLNNSQIPTWFFDPKIIYKLMPIIDFKSKDKQLAIKVIQNRCHSKNWKFLTEVKNQQFLHRLDELGINSQVWIDGIGRKTYQANNAQEITLSVSHDPLETLNMGAYFKTCLSPTSFNYFSVFANIADINKHVIYAQNTKGVVVGRVLIGLTDAGGLMVYHRYQHNAKDNFTHFVLEYIEQWMTKAGITLTQKGKVKTLVASNWYDDGEITIDNGIACYKEASGFRKSLATIASEQFIDFFKQNLQPVKINSTTFSLLLNLPELPENTLLFPILIDMAQQTKYLDIGDKITLYKLSHLMNYKNYYGYFRNDLIHYQQKKLKQSKCLDPDVALLMADNNPSDALSLVKKYGRISSKNWQENLHHKTHEIAIRALKNLGRTQKALEIELLYQT